MSSGSQQLRRYRIARRDGASVADALTFIANGIDAREAKLIEVEDAKIPPPADAYELLITNPEAAGCATISEPEHLPMPKHDDEAA